jgi:hypothetical protein
MLTVAVPACAYTPWLFCSKVEAAIEPDADCDGLLDHARRPRRATSW